MGTLHHLHSSAEVPSELPTYWKAVPAQLVGCKHSFACMNIRALMYGNILRVEANAGEGE
jgi:hypothetical protein